MKYFNRLKTIDYYYDERFRALFSNIAFALNTEFLSRMINI